MDRAAWLRLGKALAIGAVVGLFLSLSGPFRTIEAPLWLRLAYWMPMMVGGAGWGHLCASVAFRWADPLERPWLAAALMSLLIAPGMLLVVWGVTGRVFHGQFHPLSAMIDFIVPVLVVTVGMSLMSVFLDKRRVVQTHAAAPGDRPARFLDRLPPKLRGATLYAVQAEDHYLRLHTDRGSDLILMRLSDAVAELEGLEGARTHRSWWVARDAVRDVARGDGRATLTVEGGLTVPVSRAHARALRAAGWW